MIHELNIFKTQNRLTEVRLKDIKHGSMLRQSLNKLSRTDSFNSLSEKMESQNQLITQGIDESIQYIENKTTYYKEKHKKEVNLSPAQKSYILLEHLKQLQLIEDKEHSNFLYKVENNILTFDGLVDELKQRQYVSVAEPLAENIEDFIQDLSEQDADSIAGYCDKMRNNRKGIKEQTPKVVKQWFSSLFISGIILSATVVPYLISLIGFYNMDIRLTALSAVALIIALARYHYPMFLPPVALVFYPNHVLRPYKIKRGSKYFILNDKVSNIYTLNNKHRWMWDGKMPCYLFDGKPGSETEIIVAQTLGRMNRKHKEQPNRIPMMEQEVIKPIMKIENIIPSPSVVLAKPIIEIPKPPEPEIIPIIKKEETITTETPMIEETKNPIDPTQLKLYPDDLLIKVYETNLKKEDDDSRELVLAIHSELIKRHNKRKK
jgi:hypothetical protein